MDGRDRFLTIVVIAVLLAAWSMIAAAAYGLF
jgi:hypothetical protein